MALSRKIDWSSAMRDMRSDRTAPVAPGFLASRAIEAARLDRLAKEAASVPFAVSYDRSAIMKAVSLPSVLSGPRAPRLHGPSSSASRTRPSGAMPKPSAPLPLTKGGSAVIIETSDNRFYRVRATGNADLAHVWFGVAVKRSKGAWIEKAKNREILVRKAASRIVEVARG
jgi:hypothetical protein